MDMSIYVGIDVVICTMYMCGYYYKYRYMYMYMYRRYIQTNQRETTFAIVKLPVARENLSFHI